jgi:hypothetical protein
MKKFGRKPTDDQMLEGGGGGGGYKSLPRKSRNPDDEFLTKVAVGLGTPAAATGVALAADRLSKNKTPYDDLPKKEAPKKDSMTTGEKEALQEVQDEKMRQKMKTAPTTKTEMGKPFAKGGMTASSRGDGCAQRGKTKGTMVGMKNGGMC